MQQYMTMLSLVLALIIAPFANAQTTPVIDNNPYILVQNLADDLFKEVEVKQQEIHSNPNLLKEIVTDKLLPYVSYKYSAAMSLGSFYRKATPVQRSEFMAAFKCYFVSTLAQVLTQYSDQRVLVEQGSVRDAQTKIVAIKVLVKGAGREPIHLDFKMKKSKKTGAWSAIDMLVEGVSMIKSKHGEWAKTLRTQGIATLTKQLEITASKDIVLDKKGTDSDD